jgi:hypothetical protein
MEGDMHPDFYNSDAFSLVTLTTLINSQEHVPGRAGELAFAGIGEGVNTTSVDVEVSAEGALALVQTSTRGGPAPSNGQDKRKVIAVNIPHIKLEEGIGAHQIQNVRQFGSMNTLRGARGVLDGQILKQTRRHDLTLENHRLGALKGIIRDADGSTLLDLFALFGVSAPDAIDFDVAFGTGSAETVEAVRIKCQEISRHMTRNVKAVMPSSAKVWGFAGDNFFDKLIESTSVKGIWDGWQKAEQHLGGNYAHGVYEMGGVFFENYRGTDDQTRESAGTVGIAPDECQFFLTGVPGLYEEYYAPADFMETVNTLGLPRYAKVAPTDNMNRGVTLHTQQNPLSLCTRPLTLIKGTSTLGSGDFGL